MALNGSKNERIAELGGIFEGIDDDTQAILRQLVEETAYIETELETLRGLPKIRVHPRDPMKQQATPAAKMYKEYMQQYTNNIKTMLGVLGKNAQEEESPLRQWLAERRKQNEAG